jgi:hypothetical protein
LILGIGLVVLVRALAIGRFVEVVEVPDAEVEGLSPIAIGLSEIIGALTSNLRCVVAAVTLVIVL